MIGWILLFVFCGSMTYAMYAMYTGAFASNLAGLSLSGVFGVIGALFLDDVSHITIVVNNCINLTASYGEYMVVFGMCVFTGTLIYNGLTTQDKEFGVTAVQ